MITTCKQRGAVLAATSLALVMVLGRTPASTLARTLRHAALAAHVDVSGQALSISIRAAAGSRCTLQIATAHSLTVVAPITLGKVGRGTFHWTIPPSAPSGTWTFKISCVRHGHATHMRTQLVLINHGSVIDHGTGDVAPASKDNNEAGGKGGGNESCAEIATPPGGEACFINDPFATYQDGEDVGQCTWYAAGMRPDLDGITTGNAAEWLKEASGKKPEGTVPVVGAIAVSTTAAGGYGHVAYVAGVKDGGSMLILDEANLKYDERVYLDVETPSSEFQGYIYGGPAGNGPGSEAAPVPTPSPASAPTPTPAPAPNPSPTFAETTGSIVHTWTDYSNAGGTEGPEIPSNATVRIQCKTTGFAVADGNTWWYRIASPPWNGDYYGSADAFYNNGETSGSLDGTPFVDLNVPNC